MSARIVNYLYNLPRNGYQETLALLKYHLEQLEKDHNNPDNIYLFFEHYYNNQWLDHERKPDECMLEVIRSGDKVTCVRGKAYLRSGHLLYDGCYYKRQYHGRGRLYSENQDCYEGMFEQGKKEGMFFLYNERLRLREDHFVDDKLNGRSTEFFNDGKIRSKSEYIAGKKQGPAEIRNGMGGLIFKGSYVNNMKTGTAYEFLGPNVARLCQYNMGNREEKDLVYVALDYEDSPLHPKYDKKYYDLQNVVSIRSACDQIFMKADNPHQTVRICRDGARE